MKRLFAFGLTCLIFIFSQGQSTAQENIVQHPISGKFVFIGANSHPNLDLDAKSSMLNTRTGELTTLVTSSQIGTFLGYPVWSSDYTSVTFALNQLLASLNVATNSFQPITFANGYESHTLTPIEWSQDNTILMLKSFTSDPVSTSAIELWNVEQNQLTPLFSLQREQSIAGWLSLPSQWVDAKFISIDKVSWNPAHSNWLSFILDVVAIDSNGQEQGKRLGYIYNHQTQASLLLNEMISADIISLSPWNSNGSRIAISSHSGYYIVEINDLDSFPTVQILQSIDDADSEAIREWLGVADLLITGKNESPRIAYYVGQMINGTWYSQKFLAFNTTELSQSGEFAWQPTFGELEAQELSCLFDQALPAQISIGSRARVNFTDGTPLRLRDAPSFDANEISQMPEGTEFDIIGGKACVNAESYYRFWQVKLDDGTIGWAVEANLTDYFMEPLSAD